MQSQLCHYAHTYEPFDNECGPPLLIAQEAFPRVLKSGHEAKRAFFKSWLAKLPKVGSHFLS
jgi:hypothetical protein